ncbi:hypothetical protein [Granulicella sp. dw_53]|uniref:hypothetical protein n=1 Tax=Granulicella sp. dw_53 TaxID=2719792 RepID=UPI001BD52B2C|nr:hypothetical protein [Granulicella sp. dw_53]
MSTILLFLLGLCSIASPHDLKKATVHHRAPVHSSRTSRDLSRSRTSSSRTSAEAEVEPEIPFDRPTIALNSSYTFESAPVDTVVNHHTLTLVALLPQPPPALDAPRMVCISCSSQDDPSIVSTLSFRPDLGRAPPLA